MAYEVKVVDQNGSSFGTLEAADVTEVTWELNGVGTAKISLATTDSNAALVIPGREIQIYHDGAIVWWGTIVRPQAGLDETTWQCAELLWYFAHRFMGRADRTNQLTNGDFEAGETGWSFSGVTHSIVTSPVVEGTNSLKLTGVGAEHNTYAYQVWTHPVGGFPGGDFVTGSVWVNISAADYDGPAREERGLVLVHRDSTGKLLNSSTFSSAGTGDIDDSTPQGSWVPLEVGIPLVEEGDTLELRLYPPEGVAYFDLATLTFMESLSFGYPPPGVDVTDIIAGIVAYAQDRSPYDFGHGKSDLNITSEFIDDGADPTLVYRQVAYQFAEHRSIFDAIMEFVRDGVCDISIEVTSTTRTFTVWPGRRGTLYGTTLELDVNLQTFTWSADLENAASSVVLLGPGDGPDRPEGGATDPTFVGGAFTAEIVEQATDDVTVGQLDARAAERLAVAARPEILEVTTLPGAGVIGDLAVGDTVHVTISWGWVDIDDVYRVARIRANLVDDQATITLNAEP